MATNPMKPLRGLMLLCLLVSTGCSTPYGYLLTYTVQPYSLPCESPARRGSKCCAVDITQLKASVSGVNFSVMWADQAITEAAEKAGIREVRYADLQTLSVLNDTYVRRRLLFYGD